MTIAGKTISQMVIFNIHNTHINTYYVWTGPHLLLNDFTSIATLHVAACRFTFVLKLVLEFTKKRAKT